jgi:hypothetical protein
MATFVIPYHVNGKTRLGDRRLAQAMLADVREAAGEAQRSPPHWPAWTVRSRS